jgi:hypothetical protein
MHIIQPLTLFTVRLQHPVSTLFCYHCSEPSLSSWKCLTLSHKFIFRRTHKISKCASVGFPQLIVSMSYLFNMWSASFRVPPNFDLLSSFDLYMLLFSSYEGNGYRITCGQALNATTRSTSALKQT